MHSFSSEEEENDGLQYIIDELYKFLDYVDRRENRLNDSSPAKFTKKSMPCYGLEEPLAPQQPNGSHICAITTSMYLHDTVLHNDTLLTETNRKEGFRNIGEMCGWEKMNDYSVSKKWRSGQQTLIKSLWKKSKITSHPDSVVNFQDQIIS